MPTLRLQGFHCERDGRLLFSGLDLTLGRGDCLELRGPNGSGKSTLLRALAGLYPDYGGTIEAADSLYLGHRAGISGLLSARENLAWYGALCPGGIGVDEALARLGMAGYERVACQQLSAGQQRRVALARLLVCPAPLWLLDEPLTALDERGRQLIEGLMDAHRQGGGTVVCATHQPLGLAGTRMLTLDGLGGRSLSP
ncbi:MAG: heme ABC exporter ATP-binding protein CcmA [Pseudomonadales bacterium]